MVDGTPSGLQPEPPWKPGESGNLRGRPRNAPELKLRGLLGRHLNEIVLREVPDREGNQHVVEISRMEALVRLMVDTVLNPDPDYPAFRAECLKQILARIDPVKLGDKNGVAQPIVIVVNDKPGMAFAGTLQRNGQHLSSIDGPQVIDALRTTPCNLDFDGVSNGNGDGPTSEYGDAT